MHNRTIILILSLLLCSVSISAQVVEDEDGEFTLPEAEEDYQEGDFTGDTIWTTVVNDTLNWTPEQRWRYDLSLRLDSVLNRHRTMTVRTKVGKGRKARYVTKTVTARYRVGISLFDLTADTLIYERDSHGSYIPASNEKIFVSVAALGSIGRDHNFETSVYIDGNVETDMIPQYETVRDTITADSIVITQIPLDSIERNYLKGNIYIRGGFDPTLDKTPVDYVVGKIMALDIDSIDGRVYCYEPQRELIRGEEWFWQKHPYRFFANALYSALRSNGFAFTENNAYGTISRPLENEAQQLTSFSTPLTTVLKRMMKRSDNYYAESMLLNLCDLQDDRNWSYDRCREQVRDMVRRSGADINEFTIVDGSGLSHSNKTSPDVLTHVLRYAYHTPSIYEPFLESLPIAGVDGTIGSRMKGSPAQRNVKAKTGTVSGVSTLSGYVTAPNGHLLAFSILVNNVGSSTTGRDLQNRLCIEMAK